MRREHLDIPTRDGVADAYLTRPDGDEPRPGVLLAIDAWGLRPRIEEMADRIAARGYVVLAPNLFYRGGRAQGTPPPEMSDPEARAAAFARLRPLLDALTLENVDSDGEAYLDALTAHAPAPAAITGYCLGARVGLRLAAGDPDRVAAVGGFHGGRFVSDDPDSPHRQLGGIRAQIYLGHAGEDESNTPQQVAALDAALDAAGIRHLTEVYAGARHGYTMSDTAAYDEAADERHFEQLFALLERTLPAS